MVLGDHKAKLQLLLLGISLIRGLIHLFHQGMESLQTS